MRSREECYKGWTEALRETREALDKVSLPLDRERLAEQAEYLPEDQRRKLTSAGKQIAAVERWLADQLEQGEQ